MASKVSINHDKSHTSQSRAILLNSMLNTSTSKSSYKAHPMTKFSNSVMFGVVNSVRAIPTMYGFAAIIFSHPAFRHYMPALSKIVIFSSALHQLMFTLLSSLPFAIGQVQHVGLIFLGAMATSICKSLEEDDNVTAEAIVATTIVTLGAATAALGVCLVIMGRFKLAILASYLPMPVIGGYLAYIGIFCLYTGFALSTGHAIDNFSSMLSTLNDSHNVLLCVPGFLGGAVLLAISKNFKNPFVLSIAILLMPVLFFLVLVIGSMSLDEARRDGWVDPVAKSATITEVVSLYDSTLVHWDQIPKQMGTWVCMVFVVAFSSSLEVAAIEIDTGSKLNVNHELKTVGWSNIVSGLFGGYTGSYKFDQTIFTCRSKTNSRVVGACIILAELVIVAIPVSVMSYVPRFFLAATLIFVALDLMSEWLVLAYRKMDVREWMVVWLSFLAINYFLLEIGILLGFSIAVVNFLLSYLFVPVMKPHAEPVASVPNFGESAVPRFSAAVPNFGESVMSFRPNASMGGRNFAQTAVFNRNQAAIAHFEFCGYLFFGSTVQILERVKKAVYIRKQTSDDENTRGTERESSFLPIRASVWDIPVECLDGSPVSNDHMPTECVIMDFTRVSGMDATAARSAFLILQNYCKMQNITVVYANVLPKVRNLLLKNNAATEASFFATTDSAFDFCAKKMIASTTDDVVLQPRGYKNESISLLLHRYLGEPDSSKLLQGVDRFFTKIEVPSGHEFYRVGQSSQCFYFLASGGVTLFVNDDGSVAPNRPLTQLQTVLPNTMFGEIFFFSQQCRQTTAIASENCTVFEMSREQFDAMKVQDPALSISFLDVAVQSILK